MVFVSFYVGAGLVGVLFPLYIMMACDSNPKLVYQKGECGAGLGTGHKGCLGPSVRTTAGGCAMPDAHGHLVGLSLACDH